MKAFKLTLSILFFSIIFSLPYIFEGIISYLQAFLFTFFYIIAIFILLYQIVKYIDKLEGYD